MSASDGERGEEPTGPDAGGTQRLDKWLWFARIVKSRTLAAELIVQGKVRLNRTRVVKASQTVRPGDVLTVALRGRVQVLEVSAPGVRRGPPPEAHQLYKNLTPAPSAPATGATAQRPSGTGRPTKKDRREIDRLQDED